MSVPSSVYVAVHINAPFILFNTAFEEHHVYAIHCKARVS